MFTWRMKKNWIDAFIDLVYLSAKSYFNKHKHANILLTEQ